MAKLKIYTFPDTVLAEKAAPVARVDKSFYRLADDMLETMYCAPGIGLAANQVGILKRIIVLDTDYDLEELSAVQQPEMNSVSDSSFGGNKEDNAEVISGEVADLVIRNKKPRIIFNPEIIATEGKILFTEGCLSVPEYTAEVKRFEKLKLRYQDIDGVSRTLNADGLLAIAIQHEIDHLEGRLFIDRLSPLKKEMVRKRLRQERRIREDSGNL